MLETTIIPGKLRQASHVSNNKSNPVNLDTNDTVSKKKKYEKKNG